MNIIINIDASYIFPAKAMLRSLAEHCKDELNIYCLHNNISKKQTEKLGKFIEEKCHGKLYPISVGNMFCNMPTNLPDRPNTSLSTYYRLAAPYILPECVDKAMYMDCDMIVQGDMSAFYNQSFDGRLIVAVRDNNLGGVGFCNVKDKLKLNDKHIYFNAGLLLLNIKEIRNSSSISDVENYMQQYKDRLTYLDQDLLNVMFSGKVKYADEKVYNKQILFSEIFNLYEPDNKSIIVIHTIGRVKPWNYIWLNDVKKLFWKYSKMNGYYGRYLLFLSINSAIMTMRRIYHHIIKRIRR